MLDVDHGASDPCSDLTVNAVIMPWISQFLQVSSVILAILVVIFYCPYCCIHTICEKNIEARVAKSGTHDGSDRDVRLSPKVKGQRSSSGR